MPLDKRGLEKCVKFFSRLIIQLNVVLSRAFDMIFAMIKNIYPINPQIGKKLAAIRKQRGISQVQLAEKIGITQQMLSHYERSKRHLSAEMVILFAEALNVETDQILNPSINSGETQHISLRFIRRMKEIELLPESKKKSILQILDDMIRANS